MGPTHHCLASHLSDIVHHVTLEARDRGQSDADLDEEEVEKENCIVIMQIP